MTEEEALVLTRYVKSCCPQQPIDTYTPEAWYGVLKDLTFGDCERAVTALAGRQKFIAVSDIVTEVRRVRADRIARSSIPCPPPEVAGGWRAYQEALLESIREAGDGHGIPAAVEQQAITGPSAPPRPPGLPTSLRTALAELHKTLGPGRSRRTLADLRTAAAEQAAESRAGRPADDDTREDNTREDTR
jgi:hypothetical protein